MHRLGCFDADGTFDRWQIILKWLNELSFVYPHIRKILEEAAPKLHAYKMRLGSFEAYSNFIIKKFWDEEGYVGISAEHSSQAAKRARQQENHCYVFTRELILAAKELQFLTVFISGSPQEAVEEFVRDFEIDVVRGTQHPIENGVFVKGPLVEYVKNKGHALQEVLTVFEREIDLRQSFAIGDSKYDASMLERVGYPICFNPNRELDLIARQRGWPTVIESRNVHHITVQKDNQQVRTTDLRELLPEDLAITLQRRLDNVVW